MDTCGLNLDVRRADLRQFFAFSLSNKKKLITVAETIMHSTSTLSFSNFVRQLPSNKMRMSTFSAPITKQNTSNNTRPSQPESGKMWKHTRSTRHASGKGIKPMRRATFEDGSKKPYWCQYLYTSTSIKYLIARVKNVRSEDHRELGINIRAHIVEFEDETVLDPVHHELTAQHDADLV